MTLLLFVLISILKVCLDSQDQPYTFYKDSQEIQIFYLKADTESVSLEVAEDGSLSVSGNNVDGYIITEWRG